MGCPRSLFSWVSFVLVSSTIMSMRVCCATSTSLGINYGQLGYNLPSPTQVIPLIQSIGAKRAKHFDANPEILHSFANTDIEIMVGLSNECLSAMLDPNQALTWVKSNVQAYLPATKITGIMVGNKVLTLYKADLSKNLVPAMQSIYSALLGLGLDKSNSVTTAHSFDIMEFSYTPSAGAFKQELMGYMHEILNFHVQTGSKLDVNMYLFFAYKGSKEIPLDYVLFEPNKGFEDPTTNLFYNNMLFAQIDSVYFEISMLGYNGNTICVSETGWPSKGDVDEVTPLRPNPDLDVYIFALFDENMKPGPTSERNFGLFQPNGMPVYSIRVVCGGDSSSAVERYNQIGLMLILCLASIALLWSRLN